MARARLTPIRREEMALSVIESRVSKAQAARVYGVSAKIVSRWTARFIAQGRDGMQDRSSRPGHSPNQTGQALVAVVIAAHAASAIAALRAAVVCYQCLGITVTRLMTDNGSCYNAKTFAAACKALNLRHIRTKPYTPNTPKTNGKASPSRPPRTGGGWPLDIQTALREWSDLPLGNPLTLM